MAIIHIVSVVAAIAVIVAAVFIYLYLKSHSELTQLRFDPSTELGSANLKLKDSEANLSASNLLLDVNIIMKMMDELSRRNSSEPELVELQKKLGVILQTLGTSDEAKNMMTTLKVDIKDIKSYMVMRGEKRTSLDLSGIGKKYDIVFLQ